MRIDFKDEAALKTLTRCLLKQDFNLSVNLPPKQLVPTLPLRLNYILWIEDFIETFKLKDVIGLDIGRFLRTAQVQLYITVHNPNMITDSTFDRLWCIVHLPIVGNETKFRLAYVWH